VEGKVERSCPWRRGETRETRETSGNSVVVQGGAREGVERNPSPCFLIRLFFFSERGPREPGGGREREGEGEGEGEGGSDDTCVE